jgi:hypothetical protein
MGRRPDGNRYRTRDLTRNESFRQIFTTLGWTPPRATDSASRGEAEGVDSLRHIALLCSSLRDGADVAMRKEGNVRSLYDFTTTINIINTSTQQGITSTA